MLTLRRRLTPLLTMIYRQTKCIVMDLPIKGFDFSILTIYLKESSDFRKQCLP